MEELEYKSFPSDYVHVGDTIKYRCSYSPDEILTGTVTYLEYFHSGNLYRFSVGDIDNHPVEEIVEVVGK